MDVPINLELIEKLWVACFIGKNPKITKKEKNLNTIVGIPAYNEEKNIAAIITRLKKITDKIIVCNDGSSDLTSKIAETVKNEVKKC